MINLLDCVELARNPKLYATYLLWMMSELYETLPELGDPEKPKLVFFFDEAHLLFDGAPRALVQKIEQVVRLIRSKGVGIYFVTQSPADVPDSVLAQLSNRVQHALRCYTPAEQKAVRAAAATMRPNPDFKAEDLIGTLGVGHALVSFLDSEGVPCVVQNTSIICPQSLMAPAPEDLRAAAQAYDGMARYDVSVDNLSAYEQLTEQQEKDAERAALEAERAALEKEKAALEKEKAAAEEKARKQAEREQAAKDRAAEHRRAKIENQLISVGGQVLRRGLMSTLLKNLK